MPTNLVLGLMQKNETTWANLNANESFNMAANFFMECIVYEAYGTHRKT